MALVLKCVASMSIYVISVAEMALYTWMSFKCRVIAISVSRMAIYP